MERKACTVPAEEVARLKGLGFLRDVQTEDRFNVRVPLGNGRISAETARVLADAADKFGSGMVAMTTRQTQEIQGVPYRNADALIAFLAEHGLEPGGTGPKVRPVVSCKGTTCQYGLIDTYALSEAIHERFYKGWHETKLPHKFKIAVGGCPNNCVKPELNDLGIIGWRHPVRKMELCRGCKVCQLEKACPVKAVKLAEGKAVLDEAACNNCGRCVGKCPFGVCDEAETGYRLYVGGRWGKRTAVAQPLSRVCRTEDEVLAVIEKVLTWYQENGTPGERFADTITRIGFAKLENAVM
ncbi:MAG: (4Fe-4S)-binding protein [Oscillospiraceae bacterium]|nr:(4Fe-4S)-binding protein [Oscillospiraceae bacterium]